MGTPRPVIITSAVRGPGPASVIYRVERVGAFTLSPSSHYPEPDGSSMRVTYGAAVNDPEKDWIHPEVTDRPRVNGVELGGWSGVTTETALTHLAAVRDNPGRGTTPRVEGRAPPPARRRRRSYAGEVPYRHPRPGARSSWPPSSRTTSNRDDLYDMLRAYAKSKAKERLATEQRDITRLREEIAERQAKLDAAVARAVDQSWLLPPTLSPPRWPCCARRPRSTPASSAGSTAADRQTRGAPPFPVWPQEVTPQSDPATQARTTADHARRERHPHHTTGALTP